jgi:hypothetical protein
LKVLGPLNTTYLPLVQWRIDECIGLQKLVNMVGSITEEKEEQQQ